MIALLLLLASQDVAGPPDDVDGTLTAAPACPPGDGDEIVVCGGDPNAYRLPVLPPRPAGFTVPPARARISKRATISSGVTSGEGYAGPVPRIMVGVKVAF